MVFHFETFSPLNRWLYGNETLKSFSDGKRLNPGNALNSWVSLEKVMPAHECVNLKSQSLKVSWFNTHSYVKQALDLVWTVGEESSEELFIDNEDRANILHQFGYPPEPCFPLYFFTARDEFNSENAVYVGMTNSRSGRFSGGHRACAGLLNPRYDGSEKYLYLAYVMLLNKNSEYLPLKWVQPYEAAFGLLSDIESQLIYELQLELNRQKRERYRAKNPLIVHIENHTEESDFLHDTIIFPK